MKRLLVVAIVVVSMSVIVTVVAFAQEPEPPQPGGKETNLFANPFTWATDGPPDWGRGALYAVLGLFGAVVTVYGVIGGFIPTAAGEKLEADYKKLETKSKELAELRARALKDPGSVDAALITAFAEDEDRARDDLDRKRQRLFRNWAIAYVLLGMFFALLLAQDMLQALMLGAGWTSVIAALGLTREHKKDKAEGAKQAEVYMKHVSELEKRLSQLKEKIEEEPALDWDAAWDFEEEVKGAQESVLSTKLRAEMY